MQVAEGKIGRVFMLRLEDGEIVPDCIEEFAAEKGIKTGQVLFVGGIGEGDVVTGPRTTDEMPPEPMVLPIDGAHEVVAAGIIAPAEGKPVLHIHGSLGRSGKTTTGCLREGVSTWLIGEVIIYEITGIEADRVLDKESGFRLLQLKEAGQSRS